MSQGRNTLGRHGSIRTLTVECTQDIYFQSSQNFSLYPPLLPAASGGGSTLNYATGHVTYESSAPSLNFPRTPPAPLKLSPHISPHYFRFAPRSLLIQHVHPEILARPGFWEFVVLFRLRLRLRLACALVVGKLELPCPIVNRALL